MATTEHDQDDRDTNGPREPEPASNRVRPRRGRGRIAATVSVIGELLITGGVILGLFVVYSLWWTNVLADRQAQREGDQVRRQWAQPTVPGKPFDSADGIGFLHVPAMGDGFEVLVKKGTSVDVLNQGVAGYYTSPVKSAMPWDKTGNFTTAARGRTPAVATAMVC